MTTTGSPFYLRVGSVWVTLDDFAVDVAVADERPRSEFVSLGGSRFSQRAPLRARQWALLGGGAASPSAVRWLNHAATVSGAYFLYDGVGARLSLLAPTVTTGAGAAIATDAGVQLGTLAAGATASAGPLRAVAYAFSGWTSASSGTVIGVYSVGAGNVNVTAPAGTGSRYWSVAFTPADGASFLYTQTTASNTTGLRLSEGPRVDSPDVADLGFLPGERAVCRITVRDADRTYRRLLADRLPWVDHVFVLREVG